MAKKGPHTIRELTVSDIPPTITETPPIISETPTKPATISGIWQRSSADSSEQLMQLTDMLALFEDRSRDAIDVFREQINQLVRPLEIKIHMEDSEVRDLTPPSKNYIVITNPDKSVSLFVPFSNATAEIIFAEGEAEKVQMDVWLKMQSLIVVASHEIRKENSNKKAGTSTAAINHDIRNMLGVIAILTDESYGPHHRPDSSPSGPKLRAIVSRIINLTTQAMHLSLDQAGNTKILMQETQLDTLLEKIKEIFDEKCQIAKFTDIETITVDPTHLERVIFNLVQNAIKFSDSSAKPVEITVYKENGKLVIEVRDHGPGFTLEPDKLFEYFKKGHQDKSNGYGIGLGYCKHVVETMGGTIEARNNNPPRKGATFTIKLPLT